MRRDVQDIFRGTPHEKQVMMFSATLSKDIRPICKKFMQDVIIPSCCHMKPAVCGLRDGQPFSIHSSASQPLAGIHSHRVDELP